jgi:hypothetical protein
MRHSVYYRRHDRRRVHLVDLLVLPGPSSSTEQGSGGGRLPHRPRGAPA